MRAIFSGIYEYKSQPQLLEKLATLLATVVQKVDRAIRWINLYPVDSADVYVLCISLLLKKLLLSVGGGGASLRSIHSFITAFVVVVPVDCTCRTVYFKE